jgi:tetratricopeptide (TPR) repeat protein
MRATLVALLAVPSLWASAARADGTPTALADAVAAAARAGKPLVIELWGPSCGPCVRMEQEVFPAPRVKAALARVHLQRLDGSQGPGEEVHDFVRARGWPTFVRVGARGQVEHTLYGFTEAGRFAAWLEAVAERRPYHEVLRDEIRREPRRAEPHLALARLLRDDGRLAEALPHYRSAERLDPRDAAGVGAEAALERVLVELSQRQKPERLRAISAWLDHFHPRARIAPAVLDALHSFGGAPRVDVERVLRAAYARVRDRGDQLEALVLAALRAEQWPLALEAARRLVALHPTHVPSRVLLAECHHLAGQPAVALQTLDAAAVQATESQRFALREVRARFLRAGAELPPQLEHGAPWLWREPPLSGLPTPDRADEDRRRARHADRRRVLERAREQCGPLARGLPDERGYLRLELRDGVIREVTLLEPGALAPLRACLRQALVGRALPAPIPPGARAREVVGLALRPPGAPLPGPTPGKAAAPPAPAAPRP